MFFYMQIYLPFELTPEFCRLTGSNVLGTKPFDQSAIEDVPTEAETAAVEVERWG